jgi:hypothetical protein
MVFGKRHTGTHSCVWTDRRTDEVIFGSRLLYGTLKDFRHRKKIRQRCHHGGILLLLLLFLYLVQLQQGMGGGCVCGLDIRCGGHCNAATSGYHLDAMASQYSAYSWCCWTKPPSDHAHTSHHRNSSSSSSSSTFILCSCTIDNQYIDTTTAQNSVDDDCVVVVLVFSNSIYTPPNRNNSNNYSTLCRSNIKQLESTDAPARVQSWVAGTVAGCGAYARRGAAAKWLAHGRLWLRDAMYGTNEP